MSRQENRLQHAYSFWHSNRASGKPSSAQPYDQQIQQVTSFETVEGFWRAYSHMSKYLASSYSKLKLFQMLPFD